MRVLQKVAYFSLGCCLLAFVLAQYSTTLTLDEITPAHHWTYLILLMVGFLTASGGLSAARYRRIPFSAARSTYFAFIASLLISVGWFALMALVVVFCYFVDCV